MPDLSKAFGPKHCVYCRKPIDHYYFDKRYIWDVSVICPHCNKSQDPKQDKLADYLKVIASIFAIYVFVKLGMWLG
jgi:hypothetical protein